MQEYLDHRADGRGRCWLRWRMRPVPSADLVQTIYADYPPEVHGSAARSMLAHLLKLQAEGRVDKKGNRCGRAMALRHAARLSSGAANP